MKRNSLDCLDGDFRHVFTERVLVDVQGGQADSRLVFELRRVLATDHIVTALKPEMGGKSRPEMTSRYARCSRLN